jgi:hypothetical protein
VINGVLCPYRIGHRGGDDVRPPSGGNINGARQTPQQMVTRGEDHHADLQAVYQDSGARSPDDDSLRGRRGGGQPDWALLQVSECVWVCVCQRGE